MMSYHRRMRETISWKPVTVRGRLKTLKMCLLISVIPKDLQNTAPK